MILERFTTIKDDKRNIERIKSMRRLTGGSTLANLVKQRRVLSNRLKSYSKTNIAGIDTGDLIKKTREEIQEYDNKINDLVHKLKQLKDDKEIIKNNIKKKEKDIKNSKNSLREQRKREEVAGRVSMFAAKENWSNLFNTQEDAIKELMKNYASGEINKTEAAKQLTKIREQYSSERSKYNELWKILSNEKIKKEEIEKYILKMPNDFKKVLFDNFATFVDLISLDKSIKNAPNNLKIFSWYLYKNIGINNKPNEQLEHIDNQFKQIKESYNKEKEYRKIFFINLKQMLENRENIEKIKNFVKNSKISDVFKERLIKLFIQNSNGKYEKLTIENIENEERKINQIKEAEINAIENEKEKAELYLRALYNPYQWIKKAPGRIWNSAAMSIAMGGSYLLLAKSLITSYNVFAYMFDFTFGEGTLKDGLIPSNIKYGSHVVKG